MALFQGKMFWKRILRPGMKGRDVTILQRHLSALRYYEGECDGFYGTVTKGAVFDFQKAHRLRVDGICGKEVFALLRSGLERMKLDHTVADGETLQSIARKYNVPQELLITANRIDINKVREGDSLIIPVLRLIAFCSCGSSGDFEIPYERILPSVTAIAPRWFQLNADGNIQGELNEKMVSLASVTGVDLWPVISAEDLTDVLPDSKAYSRVIRNFSNLAALAARKRMKGLIFSINSLHEKDIYMFQSFFRKTTTIAKKRGLLSGIEMSLYNKVIPCNRKNRRSRLRDLRGITSIMHMIFLKAYKDPSEFQSPGPIISGSCIKTILNNLTRTVDFWKLVIVVPGFGVEFSVNADLPPARKKYGEIIEITGVSNPVISQVDGGESKAFKYRSSRMSHIVYFEDAESIKSHAELALKYKLAGIAIADLEETDPKVWSRVRVSFKVIRNGGGRIPSVR